MKTILAAFVAAAISSPALALEACNRSPRSVTYTESPIKVYISDDTQRAEVSFPETHLEGIYVEVTEGMNFYITRLANKLAFMAEDPQYTGLVTIHGASGKTYLLQLVTRSGCADSQVSIENGPTAEQVQVQYDRNGNAKGLMHYLFDGELPSGYREADFSHLSREDRLVFTQGSVEFVLQSQFIGPRYIGTTYEVTNKGRVATKVAIDQIDYSNPAVRETLGRARQVAMLPSSRTLGPAPEFLTEVYADSHRGLLFIVSEKQQ